MESASTWDSLISLVSLANLVLKASALEVFAKSFVCFHSVDLSVGCADAAKGDAAMKFGFSSKFPNSHLSFLRLLHADALLGFAPLAIHYLAPLAALETVVDGMVFSALPIFPTVDDGVEYLKVSFNEVLCHVLDRLDATNALALVVLVANENLVVVGKVRVEKFNKFFLGHLFAPFVGLSSCIHSLARL